MGLRTMAMGLFGRAKALTVQSVPVSDVRLSVDDLAPDASDAAVLDALADAAGLSREPVRRLKAFHDARFPGLRRRYWAVVDFGQHASRKRLYLFDVAARSVEQFLITHGKKSELPDRAGFADVFSDVPQSNCSSLGVYLCTETYYGRSGLSLCLDGLEPSNAHARMRRMVLHGATYVTPERIAATGTIGLSDGCAAVEHRYARRLIDALKGCGLMVMWKPPAT